MEIGIGGPVEDIFLLPHCFIEASEQITPAIQNTDIHRDAVELIYYPIEKEVQLIGAINSSNFELCREILVEIKELNIKRNLSPSMMHYLVHSMISTGFRVYETLKLDEPKPIGIGIDALGLSHYDENIFEQVILMYQSLCEVNSQIQKNKNTNLVMQVVAYIRENHCIPDMSLDVISEAFDVSYYYLSRMFQDEAGQSFSQILNSSRIEHAMQLLIDTDISAQDIAKTVGYTSINTFFRSFRNMTGVTPQQYRKLNRQERSPIS